MIPYGKPVFVASQPVDMRCGFDRLAEHANAQLGRSVQEGCVVLFVSRDRHRCKLLWRDAVGWVLLYRKLDERRIILPADSSNDSVAHGLLTSDGQVPRAPLTSDGQVPRAPQIDMNQLAQLLQGFSAELERRLLKSQRSTKQS